MRAPSQQQLLNRARRINARLESPQSQAIVRDPRWTKGWEAHRKAVDALWKAFSDYEDALEVVLRTPDLPPNVVHRIKSIYLDSANEFKDNIRQWIDDKGTIEHMLP